jgi:DNA-binding PadR family transcriptional regulator
MQDKGYVESRTEPAGAIGLPRRWYRPTEYGLRVLNAWSLAARAFAAQSQEMRTGAA